MPARLDEDDLCPGAAGSWQRWGAGVRATGFFGARSTSTWHGATVRPPGGTTELVMGPQSVRVLGSREPARDRAAAWRKVPGEPGSGWRTGGRFPRRWRRWTSAAIRQVRLR